MNLTRLFAFGALSLFALGTSAAATPQAAKPVSWSDVKRIIGKLNIQYKTVMTEDGSEMLQCTWKPREWTLSMDVSLSDDLKIIWLVVNLRAHDEGAKVPPTAALSLLEEAEEIGPTYFSYDRKGRRFLLNTPIYNSGVTVEGIAVDLNRILDTIKKTQKHWDPTAWEGG